MPYLGFLLAFGGFSLGRFGHILGGQIWFIPHHWIIGLVLAIAMLFWKDLPKKTRVLIFLFAIGVFVSDFKDFTQLKTWEPEDVTSVRFWGVD